MDDAGLVPDATQVVFNSERDAGLSLYRKATDGSGGEEVLFADDQPKWPLSWSSDGRVILADRLDPATSNDIWLVPTDTSVAPTRLPGGPFAERWAQFSPDGRWVASTSDENGRRGVYLTRFPGAIGRWQVSTDGGSYPRWSRDGKELFFYSPAGRITGMPVTARGDAPELGQPVPLFEAVAPDGSGRYLYDVAADGRFLMSVPSSRTRSAELTLLVNWPSLPGADAR